MSSRALQRALCALCCTAAVACGGQESSTDPGAVVRATRVWVDASRPTPPTATYAGAPQRTLRVLIWQPEHADGLPLLVMAHGFGGLPEKFDAFAHTIAAAGYIVAAPAFPLTNEDAPGGHDAGFRDFINQPADLTFLLTQLLQANATPSDALEGTIAADQIAVLGHSLGGLTVLGLTRKACCRDPRVQASILAAAPAPLAVAFGADPLAADGPPTLILQGTADTTVSFSTSASLYDMIDPPRFLVGLKDAGHSDAVESQVEPPIPARDAAQRATIAFLNAVFRGADAAFEQTRASLAAEGNIIEADPGSAS